MHFQNVASVILILLLLIERFKSQQMFNITENQIPERLANVYDIFGLSRGDKGIILNDVEMIIDQFGSNVRNNLDINRRNGDIIVKHMFDREDLCPSKMTNECVLNYVLSYKSTLREFKLIVKDTNDNAPVFKDKMKEINIRENDNEKSSYLLPKAYDADTAAFGIVNYTIKFFDDDKTKDLFHEYFKLINDRKIDNIITPVLKVVKLLDHEQIERFLFTLTAWDKDQKFGDCKILINVIDINDNAPIWTTDPYNVEIKECSQTKEVMKLEAHDKDDVNTENGRITYEIGEKTKTNNQLSNLFHISGNMLYVDLLKMQEIYIYEFDVEIIAKDGGGKFSSKTVNVKIIDCNKNKPQFDINNRNPKITENEKKTVKLTNVVVTDPDRGLNGEFDCIIDDSYRFSLNVMIRRNKKSGTWIFYTLNTLDGIEFDREKVSVITVSIICTDKGLPSQTNTQVITVHVSDVNDNKPVFTRTSYTFSVEENIQIGTVVGTVTAIDTDINENGRISYEIESTVKDIFSINNKGQIQTNAELDREKLSWYELKVVAKDNGVNSLHGTCTVKIFVTDINDSYPEVDKQYMFEIVESRGFAQVHLNLGRIEAKDADLGLNGTLNYKISNSNVRDFGKSLLQITSDGHLSLYGNVDREAIKNIHFEIIVFDNGKPSLSTITTVIINILDVNDNKPKFTFPNYPNHNFVNVSLQTSVGSVLAVIEATDPDNGINGSVQYKLMGGEHIKSFFELHQSGQLILIKPLADKRLNPDRLLIQAVDGADPPLSEITTLYLRYFNNKKTFPSKTTIEKKYTNDQKIDKDSFKDSANVNLLYGLAAVLFIIFFVALVALFFIYVKGRTHFNQEFTVDKSIRSRINYAQKFPVSSNENKGNDELLDPSVCEAIDMNVGVRDNYTHLMFYKEPNYNLLYPRMLSKPELDAHNDTNSTQNYFHQAKQTESPMGANSMCMFVNNLGSHLSTKTPSLSNPLLAYKDSVESLSDSNYNAACISARDRCVGIKDDLCNTMVAPICSTGCTQSYITSTFV